MMSYLNFSNEELFSKANKFKETYTSAIPFPHIVLDDFFNDRMLK